ncbi:MAG: phosphoribosylformylglycinamidine synthase [Oscillospiraceae bacterium]|nr:phosphoribosylformylglycinamidine synthase [Oscillospiraceae bacterium]
MVRRVYTGRRKGFENEAMSLLAEWQTQLRVDHVRELTVFNRYDVEGIDEALFDQCVPTVFAEPQTDVTYGELPNADIVFAVESLPGQFDQRADSCAQCIQIVSGGQRPVVRTAKVYCIGGALTEAELAAIKKHVINPVESREAALAIPQTLAIQTSDPPMVAVLEGFLDFDEAELAAFLQKHGLAMDLDDLRFCQNYFKTETRAPTMTEIRMIDTYWSDHCRHTTFLTELDDIAIEDERAARSYERFLQIKKELGREQKPTTLMELATEAMRYLKHTGHLERLDESEEINACTVRTDVAIDGKTEEWLFLFKNETHNHPTEIEPFGGAATCIGGAIRDPLSGRGYVYQAMRVTGASDPTLPIEETIRGKLPQRKIVTTAAQGYSSYGNQIGLATGLVDELYHPGYVAKRLEIGAVAAAVPARQVRREAPVQGDQVVLLGGRTGRDGCGGATGSSKSHTLASLEDCGAEVQKGNAPEERKLQRLFRNPQAAAMIKRCNDFGAGGVAVAIGELTDGLVIDLDAVPKKYDGLDGTELAISESQERMAVVLAPEDVPAFLHLADAENLEATPVAVVQNAPRLVMRWRGTVIVDLARAFLNSNGAPKHARAVVPKIEKQSAVGAFFNFKQKMINLAGDLSVCSRRGLAERFDATIGAGSVFMPFGGKYQQTPAQATAALFPVLEGGKTTKTSVMAYGFDPYAAADDPYAGAYCAVVESIAKLAAAGCPLDECYLTFQEYFERLHSDPQRWGKPLAALLGAMQAQLDLKIASIGGKDSMSGSFENIDVPPTLVSFAVALCDANELITNEFKADGGFLCLLEPEYDAHGLPIAESLRALFQKIRMGIAQGEVLAAQAITGGGTAEAMLKMSMGNKIGVCLDDETDLQALFLPKRGAILAQLKHPAIGRRIGCIQNEYILRVKANPRDIEIDLNELEALYENRLESVFPMRVKTEQRDIPPFSYLARSAEGPAIRMGKTAKPRVLIPVFPGTNCEYDTARAFERAGAAAEICVVNNKSAAGLAQSIERAEMLLRQSQILFLPGGFSGGDEPDGSGKFITAFLRNPRLREAVAALLDDRRGLVGGICNGFQALIKLGLVPFGKICAITSDCPTLTYNTIGRHQSKLVRTRVASVLSPWLSLCEPDEIHLVPVSHGEGRFVCPDDLLAQLIANGQIATQYVDLRGNPSMDIQFNPNGSVFAVEGITSPDGRVFGKMGHSERTGDLLYKNVTGRTDNKMFLSAVQYFA